MMILLILFDDDDATQVDHVWKLFENVKAEKLRSHIYDLQCSAVVFDPTMDHLRGSRQCLKVSKRKYYLK